MFFETIRNAVLAGIGIQESLKEFVEDLVKKGELSATQGARIVKEWSDKAGKTGSEMTVSLSDLVKKTLDKMNLPTKDDIDKLNLKVNSLSSRLSKLEEERGGDSEK